MDDVFMKIRSSALLRASLGLVLALVGSSGCAQSDFGTDSSGSPGDGPGQRPGDEAREADADVSCNEDDECGVGETCTDGVCQMARCQDGPYVSNTPIRSGLRFFLDREILVADRVAAEGSYWVDGYAPGDGSIDYPGSWDAGSSRIVDIVGGDFFGRAPELFVVATEGSSEIHLMGSDPQQHIDVGFSPIALSAGDVDRDGRDEVVALGRFGNVALCRFDDGSCRSFVVQDGEGEDVTAGDVDGDGDVEVVLLLSQESKRFLYVWEANTGSDSDEGAANEDVVVQSPQYLTRLEAGDLDGDGRDELLGIDPGNLVRDAKVFVYGVGGGTVSPLAETIIDDSSLDLSSADLDGDERSELMVLREGGQVELMRTIEGSTQLTSELVHRLSSSQDPDRIAASDFDGDSPRTKLMNEEPVLVPGPAVPTIVAHYPPYDAERSEDESGFFVGDAQSTSETVSDTLALGVEAEVGVSGKLFDVFEVGVTGKVGREIRRTTGLGTTHFVSSRIAGGPESQFEGRDYGVVMLSCACFHAYYYQVEDPAGRLAADVDQEEFVVVLPVGGSTTGWSTPRYNAMAKAVGGLPEIEIPYLVGDVDSYPRGPQRANGEPIAEDDFVFPEVPTFLVSDIANVGWYMSVTETQTNQSATTTKIGLSGKLGVGPFSFGLSGSASQTYSYTLALGERALFGGSVPPIVDDPNTPEDEYEAYAFSFSPYVYREHYTDDEGNEGAYYVMSHAVAQQE